MLVILVLVLIFVLFIIWLWMSIACAVVAVTKSRNPVFWSILGLFLGPIAFAVLTRLPQGNKPWGNLPPPVDERSLRERACPQCGKRNPSENRYCNSCGVSLARRRVEPPKLGGGSEEESERGDGGS